MSYLSGDWVGNECHVHCYNRRGIWEIKPQGGVRALFPTATLFKAADVSRTNNVVVVSFESVTLLHCSPCRLKTFMEVSDSINLEASILRFKSGC